MFFKRSSQCCQKGEKAICSSDLSFLRLLQSEAPAGSGSDRDFNQQFLFFKPLVRQGGSHQHKCLFFLHVTRLCDHLFHQQILNLGPIYNVVVLYNCTACLDSHVLKYQVCSPDSHVRSSEQTELFLQRFMFRASRQTFTFFCKHTRIFAGQMYKNQKRSIFSKKRQVEILILDFLLQH